IPCGRTTRTLSLELDHAWTDIRTALREAVGEPTYGLWLEPLRCEGLSGDILLLSGPHEVCAWASDRLARVLHTCAATVLGPQVTVELAGESGDPDSGTASSLSPTRGDTRST